MSAGAVESLSVPARLESLARIGRYVLDAAGAAGLDARAAYRLRLAVDEIATNIIVHGYDGGRRAGHIDLCTQVDDRRLIVCVEDGGPAFDPETQPEPLRLDRPVEEREPGGLGVFLAVRSVDEFRYERAGDRNRNTFVMYRRN